MAEQPTYQQLVQGKDVIIVAPGAYVQDAGMGEWIDSHDLVIRLNWGCPVPEALKKDLGSRTDILYKRLLKLGRIDHIDVQEYLDEGLQYIVAVERANQSRNMQIFREMVGDKIPWILEGSVRRMLKRELRTSPLVGVVALRHLMGLPVKSIQLYGMDFYQTGYYDGYGGRDYRESMNRKEGTIGRTHNGAAQLKAVEQWRRMDPRIKFDSMLKNIVDTPAMRGPRLMKVVIPARAKSSRFPNKPLALINGEPMILRVCRAVERAGGDPVVATDTDEIASVVKRGGFLPVLTSADALTGTDRVAEAVARLRLRDDSIILNVQGDEPLISAASIERVLAAKKEHRQYVIGAYCAYDGDPTDSNVVKVVLGKRFAHGKALIYASRVPVPARRDGTHLVRYAKQVGIYAYTVEQLKRFAAAKVKTPIEELEDIEILRFLELGQPVIMTEVEPSKQAVDLPEHIQIVEEILNGRAN